MDMKPTDGSRCFNASAAIEIVTVSSDGVVVGAPSPKKASLLCVGSEKCV